MTKTRKDFLSLNLAGTFNWDSEEERDANVMPAVEAIRSLPSGMQAEAVDEIITKLDVSVPEDAFTDLYLTWDQALEMVMEGIELGSRTNSQPILTSIPMEIAYREIVESKRRIEEKVDREVLALSYPRGLAGDYDRNIMKILHKAGYRMAFTNAPGPDEYSEFPRKRFAIRRIAVNHSDTFPQFLAKLNGVSQLNQVFSQLKN
jgi:peptidoglycan/xylan/chitin deacetylase (PgdA/CDA1 family)